MSKKKSQSQAEEGVFANVTRYVTEEEKAQTRGIKIDEKDLENYLRLVRDGLIEAAAGAEQAVQNNMALSVETAIRLTRPVFNAATNEVEELTLKKEVEGRVRAKKIPRKSGTA